MALERHCKCDQIGQFFSLWATFESLLKAINLPKSLIFLGNICKGVKIQHFSNKIIYGQILQTFGDYFWSHWKSPIKQLCYHEGYCSVSKLQRSKRIASWFVINPNVKQYYNVVRCHCCTLLPQFIQNIGLKK